MLGITLLKILTVALGLTAGVLLVALWFQLRPKVSAFLTYARAMGESGHLGGPITDRAHAEMKGFAGFCVRLFLGKIESRGAEKLATAEGPFLVAFNHGNIMDVAIAPLVLNRKARYPAAQGVMQAFGGLVGGLFGRWGAFAVNLENGATALQASVKVMEAGEVEVIFPEAWTHMTGEIREFKSGTVRIAKLGAEKIGRPIAIYPGYMKYNRYPGKWILNVHVSLQWLIVLLGAAYYGRGAQVVIGEPIWSNELPEDHHEATNVLRNAIIALKPAD